VRLPPVLLWAVAMGSVSCAAHRFVMPSGRGEPAPDAAANWDEATRDCRSVRAMSATLVVGGKAGSSIPDLDVFTGATADGGIYLEARYSQSALFTFGGTAERATLVLQADNRFIIDRADRILDALASVAIGPDRWLALLSGCATTTPAMQSAERFGKQVVVTTGGGRVVLESRDSRWRTVGAAFDHLTVRYDQWLPSAPAHWVLASAPGVSPDVALDVRVRDPHINDPAIDPARFAPPLPAGATVMTLDELRESGPLQRKK
jgi:hypothetical protein